MAFGITDGTFFSAFVSQFVIDIAYVPLLIGDFFEELNPIIGNTHTQLVIEAYAFFSNRRGKTGQSAHLFGNGQRFGVELVNKLVSHSEIHQSVVVLIAIIIETIIGKGFAQTVIVINHTGNAVEAETVEAIFF